MADWTLYAMIAAMVVFFFFIYLFIRRIVTGFTRGMREGRTK
jgi:hypothetical protein